MKRRLAAILAADVVGYSRLMGMDEANVLERLKRIRREIVQPSINEHDGRTVKLMGDGLLAEFPSVVEAVLCSARIQARMAEQEASIPDEQRIELRIGINLGDIIVEGSDIYGDGVNVAARLESLAEPGTVCISGQAHDTIDGKLDLEFEDLGTHRLKNITRPVRAYRLRSGAGRAQSKEQAKTHPATGGKPSIVVLPFRNLSGDTEQDFFSDGVTEDIITALSQIEAIYVVARSASFAQKGRAVESSEAAIELGVRYALEGSVRMAGNRMRLTTQLVNANTAEHVWAERFDRELTDIFDVQDEITGEVVSALQIKLTEGEMLRARRKQTSDLAAWADMAKGVDRLRRFTREDNEAAREFFERAVGRDPKFASAWSMLGWTHLVDARLAYTASADLSLEQGAALLQKALELDENDADSASILGAIRLMQRQFEEAEKLCLRSIELGPNVADCYAWLATVYNYTGRPKQALVTAEKAMRLSPVFPDWYYSIVALAYRGLGRLEEAIEADNERLKRNPQNPFSNFRIAEVLVELGHLDKAKSYVEAALAVNPKTSVRQVRHSEPFKDEAELERYLSALRDAGLPDSSGDSS